MRDSVKPLQGKRELALGEENEGRKEGVGTFSRSLSLMGEQDHRWGGRGGGREGGVEEGKGGRSHIGKEQRHGIQSREDGQL